MAIERTLSILKPDALQTVSPGPPSNRFVVTDVTSGATFARTAGATTSPDTPLTPPVVSGGGSCWALP